MTDDIRRAQAVTRWVEGVKARGEHLTRSAGRDNRTDAECVAEHIELQHAEIERLRGKGDAGLIDDLRTAYTGKSKLCDRLERDLRRIERAADTRDHDEIVRLIEAGRRLPKVLDALHGAMSQACEDPDHGPDGWPYDTLALSSYRDACDVLVEHGRLERREGGAGRRWFYRDSTREAAEGAR